MFDHVDFTVLELIHLHCSSVKSFPARSGSGADFILAAPDAEPAEPGELRRGPKSRLLLMVTALCLHEEVKLFLGTIRTLQIFSGHSQCYAHLLSAGPETRGFAALLSPFMRLFNFNPPLKSPVILPCPQVIQGANSARRYRLHLLLPRRGAVQARGLSPAVVITAIILSSKDRHSGYFCAISTRKMHPMGCSGCQCPRRSSAQLTEHLSG